MSLRRLVQPLVRPLHERRRRAEIGPSTWETVPVPPRTETEGEAFDGERAFELLRAQCEMGPRFAGMPGHARAVEWMTELLRPLADALVLQRWDQKVGRGPCAGSTLRMVNVLALIRGTEDAEGDLPELMLSAHWDTKPVADHDPDPARRALPVPGANDGASGIAVLLEVARALRVRPPKRSVVLALFDGEDMGEYYYGSRAYTAALARGAAPWRARRGIVADMVGKRGLRCSTDELSLQQAPELWRELHACADQLGIGGHFGGRAGRFADDHVFLSAAGIPSVLLIDYEYPQWHTTADDVDQCDAGSLQVVGDLLLHFSRFGPPANVSAAPLPSSPARVPATPLPLALRGYFAINSGWNHAGALLQAAYDGFWLGALGRESLYRIDQHFYDRNAAYHGDAHNLRGLMPWEDEALKSAFEGCRRLLVLGAGGGREVIALARRGYEVEGFECNQALASYAAGFLARQGCTATVRYLPRDAVPEDGQPFDGIILGWGAYMLTPGSAHRTDLLRRLRARIRPGGPILLSFWTRSTDGPRFRIAAAVANAVRLPLRRERVEMGDALQPNFVHFFTAPEVAAELRQAGWEPHRYTPHGSGGRDSGWAIGIAPGGEAKAG